MCPPRRSVCVRCLAVFWADAPIMRPKGRGALAQRSPYAPPPKGSGSPEAIHHRGSGAREARFITPTQPPGSALHAVPQFFGAAPRGAARGGPFRLGVSARERPRRPQ